MRGVDRVLAVTHALKRGRLSAARACKVVGLAATLVLSACGGGGDGTVGGEEVTNAPFVTVEPISGDVIVGQLASFHVEASGLAMAFEWQEQRPGADWVTSTGAVNTQTESSDLLLGPVDIGMDQTRIRSVVSNPVGSVTSAEATLSVVWGRTSTLEPNTFDFGPGSEGFGSADGGTPGGGDGEGAGVGGGLGKTIRTRIALQRVADGASLGEALTGATSGLVRVKAGPGAAPLLITLQGGGSASYYDEGKSAMLPLSADTQLHALALAFDQHLGVTVLTEAAYRYAINHYIVDPVAVRNGTVALQRAATPEQLARLTPEQIQLAHEAIRQGINSILPTRYNLDSIATLPTPVDTNSGPGSITSNRYGTMQAVTGGLALAAARFNGSLANPALTMAEQLANDLTDGVIDGQSLDQQTVFGAPGAAYGPDSLPAFLADAADAMFGLFGDGSTPVAPVITAQPTSASITVGNFATLSVEVIGQQLSFQWFRNDQPISAATFSVYDATEAGTYFVRITNGGGTVDSNRVTVTVTGGAAAPSITTQPVSASVTQGELAAFFVVATGPNLRYQWHIAGTGPIPGANEATYTTGTAGGYFVVVSNTTGSVTSSTVTLTVTPRVVAPSITTQPLAAAIPAGGTATLSVAASGSPLNFQWHNAAGPITGANASSYSTGTAGSYFVVVSNTAGTVTSNTVAVTLIAAPTITTQPVSITVPSGQSATLSVVAAGTGPLTYQWRNAGGPITGATSATYVTSVAGSYTVVVTNAAGSVTSEPATVTVAAVPVITTQPLSATIDPGETATLTVVATGTAPLTYQWRNAGGPISGATSATYATTVAGTYTVVVSNAAGTVTSTPATVTVTVANAPVITTQPVSVTIAPGGTATLTVVATGTGTLTYQWRNASGPITGATSSTYSTGAAGTYTVTVTNSAGSITSNAATVTIATLPVITTQPLSQTIPPGGTATLSITATGTAPLTYQWRNANGPITGATSATYSTTVSGTYSVTVTNLAGSVTSSTATVTIASVPVITTQPVSVIITPPQTTATLSVVATGAAPLSYQWQIGAVGGGFTNIASATSASYSTSTVGSYRVIVSNAAGPATSNVVTVTVAATAPTITTQPVSSVTIPPGQSASLNVIAAGSTPLSYQWQVSTASAGFSNIASATSSTYITSVAGTYRVIVSNAAGTVTSTTSTVTVASLPVILEQPQSITVPQGEGGTFSVAIGPTSSAISYQWQVLTASASWAAISGATLSSYSTTAAGTYRVVVTSLAGFVNSDPATLTFDTLPTIMSQPQNYSGPGPTNLTVIAGGVDPFTYQWYFISPVGGPGQVITGATRDFYAATSSGSYFVRVSNAAGTVQSRTAAVSIAGGPLP